MGWKFSQTKNQAWMTTPLTETCSWRNLHIFKFFRVFFRLVKACSLQHNVMQHVLSPAISWLILSKSRHVAFTQGPILGVCLISSRARILMLFISQETICVLLDITSRGGGRVELKTWSCVFSFNNQTSLSCQHWPMRGQPRVDTDQWEGSVRDGDNTPPRPGTNSDFHHHCWPSQTIINGNASWRMFLFCHNGDNFPAGIRSPPRQAGPAPRLLIIRNF